MIDIDEFRDLILKNPQSTNPFFQPIFTPSNFYIPTQSTEPFVITEYKGEPVITTRTIAGELEREEKLEKEFPLIKYIPQPPPLALIEAVSPNVPEYKVEKSLITQITPSYRELSLGERVVKGVYGLVGTASLFSPSLLIATATSAGLSAGIGAGFRYVFQGKEKALAPEEVKADIMTGTILGPFGYFAGPYLQPYVNPWIRTGIGAGLGFSSVLARDVSEEVAKGEEPKISYHPISYAVGAGLGALSGYGTPKLQELIEEGKIPVVKPGYVKGSEKERWIGLYYEKGPEAKQIIGVKWGEGLEIGRNLKFKEFIPGQTPWKSPIEISLSKEAMMNYYKDLAEKGALKGSLTPNELEKLIDIVKDVYKYAGKESVKISLLDIVKSAERLKGVNKKEFYDFLINYVNKGKAELYGSATLKMLMGEHFTRETHDFDIQLIKGNSKEFVDEFLEKFGKENFIVKEVERGHQIYNKAGEKILEVFNPGQGYYSLKGEYLGYGFGPLPAQKTKEGLIMQLRESTARKLSAGFAPTEKGIAPAEEKYIKHAEDLIRILIYYAKTNPQLKPKIERFLANPSSDLLKSILNNLDNINVKFVISGVRYNPSDLSASFSAFLSNPAFVAMISSANAAYKASKSSQSQPVKSESASKSESVSKSSSYTSQHTPSYSYSYTPPPPSIPSPSSSYSSSSHYYPYYHPYPSYSFFPYPSYSPPPSPPSSPPSSQPSPPSSPPILYPPTAREIELRPGSRTIAQKTRWVSELSYI